MQITTEDQTLYYKGKLLAEDKKIVLVDKAIIHVKNANDIKEDVTISIIEHIPQKDNLYKVKLQSIPVKVNLNDKISIFLNTFLHNKKE